MGGGSGARQIQSRGLNILIVQRWYSLLQMGPSQIQALCVTGLFAISMTASAQSASAPQALESQAKTVHFDGPSTATLVLQARGEGTQIYTCIKDADWAWKLKAPDATLFNQEGKKIGKHFAGPTWRLKDGSEVQGKVLEVRQQPGTIPWLILAAHSTGEEGRLSHVDVVRRTETHGGSAPPTGCDATHEGAEVRTTYSATYSFFDSKQ
jgi:hypothetical protein